MGRGGYNGPRNHYQQQAYNDGYASPYQRQGATLTYR